MTRCRRQKQLPKLEYEFLPEHALRMRTSSATKQIRTHGLSLREGTRNHLNQSGFKNFPGCVVRRNWYPYGPWVYWDQPSLPQRLTRHDTHQMGPGLFALRTNQFRSKVEPTLLGRILTLVQYGLRREVPSPPFGARGRLNRPHATDPFGQ